MAKKKNDAFDGDHLTRSGDRTFTIKYRDRFECAAINNALKRPWPRISPHYPRVGWVYGYKYTKDAKMTGPFTSSRKAWLHAMETLK